jgi:hypothetical protein
MIVQREACQEREFLSTNQVASPLKNVGPLAALSLQSVK